MVDLLHAYAIQQLEVALLGSPVAQVVDLLAEGFTQAQASTFIIPVQPHPKFSTNTPPAPPPCLVPVEGISTSSPTQAVAPASLSDIVESAVLEPKERKASDIVPFRHISPIPVGLSSSASTTSLLVPTSVTTLPVVVVPQLAIPAEAEPEWINRPGGGKDYLWHLCPLRHPCRGILNSLIVITVLWCI